MKVWSSYPIIPNMRLITFLCCQTHKIYYYFWKLSKIWKLDCSVYGKRSRIFWIKQFSAIFSLFYQYIMTCWISILHDMEFLRKKFCKDMYTSPCCSCSVTKLCSTLCDPVDQSPPGFPALYHLQEHDQTHIHWTGDALQLPHPVASSSPCLQSSAASRHLFSFNISFKISPMIFLKSTKVSIASIKNQTGRWWPHCFFCAPLLSPPFTDMCAHTQTCVHVQTHTRSCETLIGQKSEGML